MMNYTFELIGIAPILHLFNHQFRLAQQPIEGAEYLASERCTLDAFLASAEMTLPRRGWNLDRVVDSVVHFWIHNAEQVRHWQHRLEDAGHENLLVARVADIESMRVELESLLTDS
ncbi:hypothetical protein ACQ4M4_27160 [Leptolyngbya sp. AN02str]|uniref:hypothetical protein n=1 Tax=Leptolyngbya sp. AN02str TaxID=3423363 RepID=UPI003D31BDF6